MSGFNDFISAELPKRPFTSTDGAANQMLVRSSNALAAREMTWVDSPGIYYAGTDISGHIAVIMNDQGKVVPASSDSAVDQYVVGITLNAAVADASIQTINTGVIEHIGWTFIVGVPVYLGLSGAITQTIPPTALFTKVLGVALTTTKISVNLQTAIFF